QAERTRARTAFVCDCTQYREALPPAGGAGIARQWQADPRIARHRYSAGGAALLLSRGLGAVDGARTAGVPTRRRDRTGDPLELPAADAGVEDCPGTGDVEYGG